MNIENPESFESDVLKIAALGEDIGFGTILDFTPAIYAERIAVVGITSLGGFPVDQELRKRVREVLGTEDE